MQHDVVNYCIVTLADDSQMFKESNGVGIILIILSFNNFF